MQLLAGISYAPPQRSRYCRLDLPSGLCLAGVLSSTHSDARRDLYSFALARSEPCCVRTVDFDTVCTMSTAVAIPMPMSPLDQRHMPVLSTLDPSFSPSSLHLQPYTNPTRSPSVRGSPVMRASPTPSVSTTKSDSLREDVFATGASPDRSAAVAMGSRHERVPYDGPGTAVYVRQPGRAQLVRFSFARECVPRVDEANA